MAGGPWIGNAPARPALKYDARTRDEPSRHARTDRGRLFGKAEAISSGERTLVEHNA